MKKYKSFLEGLPLFEVVLDHRPLIPILNDYTLDKLDNQRLLRLRLQMSRFSVHARWVPGKENIEADVLSRLPVDQPTEADLLGEGPTSYTARKAVVNMIAEWSGTKKGNSRHNPRKHQSNRSSRPRPTRPTRSLHERFSKGKDQFGRQPPPLLE